MAYFRGMKRGYIRGSVKHSESGQLAILTQAGVSTSYTESKTETVADFIESLRAGDDACVATLARLAPNRQMLRNYIQQIHDKGAVVFEAKTGRRLDTPEIMAVAMLDAVDELAQDKRTHSPEDAQRFGRMGGRKPKEKLARKKAERVWFDARIKTVSEALAHMPGWSTRMAYRLLGPRGVSVGRPPHDEK